jgi:hypothetical protein
MVEGALNQVPVVDDGRTVGLLARADMLRFLQLRDELFTAGRGRTSVARSAA